MTYIMKSYDLRYYELHLDLKDNRYKLRKVSIIVSKLVSFLFLIYALAKTISFHVRVHHSPDVLTEKVKPIKQIKETK